MNEKVSNSANTIYNFIEVNNSYLILTVVIAIVGYFYFRNKVKMIYLLDFMMLMNFIIIMYFLSAPHRYNNLSYFLAHIFS